MLTFRTKLLIRYAGLLVFLAVAGTIALFAHDLYTTILLLVAGVVLSAFLLYLQWRSVIKPLNLLTDAVRKIQAGDMNTPVVIAGGDELGRLAESFNHLNDSLKVYRQIEEERLTRTRDTMRAAISSLPDAIAVLSPEGNIELANGVAEKLFGLTPGISARDSGKKWLVNLVDEVRRTKARAAAPGAAVQVFDQGQERLFLPHAIPILDPDQKIVGITAVLVDATDLQHVDEAKSGLLARVSHELKTPLTSIQMALHLLIEDANLPPRQLELLKTACEDADRLHDLVNKHLGARRQQDQIGSPSPGDAPN